MTKKIEYYATVCKECPYSSYLFHRNYFAGLSCSCAHVYKDNFCGFCENLKDHLNYRARKACIEVKDKNSFPFEIIPVEKRLWSIKADPFFMLDKNYEYFEVLIDHPSHGDFFIARKLIKKMNFPPVNCIIVHVYPTMLKMF